MPRASGLTSNRTIYIKNKISMVCSGTINHPDRNKFHSAQPSFRWRELLAKGRKPSLVWFAIIGWYLRGHE